MSRTLHWHKIQIPDSCVLGQVNYGFYFKNVITRMTVSISEQLFLMSENVPRANPKLSSPEPKQLDWLWDCPSTGVSSTQNMTYVLDSL